MKIQDSYNISTRDSRPQNGRRDDKGMSFCVAFLGAICVAGVFGLLALLFHLG